MNARSAFTRLMISAALCSLGVGGIGCVVGGGSGSAGGARPYPGQQPGTYPAQSPAYPGAPASAMAGGASAGGPAPPEAFRPAMPRQHAVGLLFLPGSQAQRLVKYSVVEGQAVMEGDILLGPAAQLPFRYGLPWAPMSNVKSAVATSVRTHLWPRGEMPFVIDSSISPKLNAAINGAVAHLNTTSLRARPRREEDRDYVVFRDTNSGCSSYVGRIGGPQDINLTAGCGQGSVVHEMLHAGGFFHEQSRGDRDQFVTIAFNEISPGFEDNFEKRDGRGQDIGGYDFGSIMHYSGRAFSRSGQPTIIPKVPGVSIGQREGLSSLDRAAIEELYGSGGGVAPSAPAPAPGPAPAQPSQPAPMANGSFAGNYASNRGNVACTQSNTSVNCQYPGGGMLCSANGPQLDCAWSGGGQGRAVFQRQANGVVAGTFGDFFSHDSRGAWSLTPSGGSAPSPAAPPPTYAPPAQSTTPPPANGSLAGNYASSRGPMTCSDNGASIACNFQENPSAPGRLDCNKDATGTVLSCVWATFFPPGSGRASFSRRTAADRNFTGTWGHFTAAAGAGTWQLTAQ